jgi:uncharacterized protein (TIGR00369 family)
MTARPIEFPVHIPFVERLGLELWAFGDGAAELRVDLSDAHLNSWSVAHGGVLMTMLDVAMAHAARSSIGAGTDPTTAPGVATIEMKTSFMRPAEGALSAHGGLLHRTATLAFCEARVLDADGLLCAQATGTFKILRALAGRTRQIRPLRRRAVPDEEPR